jgi:hypothetical protein
VNVKKFLPEDRAPLRRAYNQITFAAMYSSLIYSDTRNVSDINIVGGSLVAICYIGILSETAFPQTGRTNGQV